MLFYLTENLYYEYYVGNANPLFVYIICEYFMNNHDIISQPHALYQSRNQIKRALTVCFSPVTHAWEGGKALASSELFEKLTISRLKYEEEGVNAYFNNSKFEFSTSL